MKMKEGKSEENFVKKERKHKKGQASVHVEKNCTDDDGSLAEVKKEKKGGKNFDVIVIDTEEGSCDEGGEKEEKKKKKKRKVVSESVTDSKGHVVNNVNAKKMAPNGNKKKKKKQVETIQLSLVKEEVAKKREEKKMKNKAVQMKPENVKMEKEGEEGQQAGKNKFAKKAKKEQNGVVVITEETEEPVKKKKKKKKTIDDETTEAMDGVSVTKKETSAKMKVSENEVKSETPEGETAEVEEVKVKKKKKKEASAEEGGNESGMPKIKGKNKISRASSNKKMEKEDMPNKKKDTKNEIVIVEQAEMGLKKKGTKQKGRKASVEVSEVEETEPKKKKRKKGNSTGEADKPLVLKCEEAEEQSSETIVTGKKSKKKKSSTEVGTPVEALVVKKKKKMIKEEVEDEHESPHVDVVFLSEKTGNTDEVNINQERRQALQMEIDKASQPQKAAKSEGLGQWSTAQFDNSSQQQKFLRLMGGFKKGFQPAGGSSGGANMALGKDAQQQLQQGLLGEFERAQSRRMDFSNRGSGLGFTAPSNKKFSIDISSCRSVRFDD